MLKEKKAAVRHFDVLFSGAAVIRGVWLVGCGYQMVNSAGYSWNGMMRGSEKIAIWQYTISGHGMIRRHGKDHRVGPGQAFMVPVPDEHVYYFPADSDHWEFIFMTLSGEEAVRLWYELVREAGPVVEFSPDARCVATASEVLKLREENRLQSPYLVSRYAYDFIMDIFIDLNFDMSGRRDCPDFVAHVNDFCLRNLSRRIGVNEMAEVAGLSRFHFSREFSRYVGVSPAEYLHDLRMRKALSMLQTELMTVKEIAFACGFEDSSYFCKVFRSFYGNSPDAFRRGDE